jgi:hypothetical protein
MSVAVKLTLYADRIQKRIAAKQKRVLFKQGKYLKTTMQRSMRYSNKPSQPGKPPHAHKKNSAGPLLRKLIAFAVNLREGSVTCGPKLFARSTVVSSEPLPQVLNEGGDVTNEVKGKRVTEHIATRPFTQPVFSDGGENFRRLIEKESL